ncbi:MAG TPA: hypothetical protein VKP30_26835 [Polyangiaceae bacterium]|nr:hypothetical protein [Polyangiaceae bacterium]
MSIRFPRVLGVLALTANSQALAAEYAQARIEQEAPAGAHCPTADTLAIAVEQRLQRRVFVPDAPAALLVRVSYSREQADWVATVELFAPEGQALGQRRIVSLASACDDLAKSLPLVIALMLDLTREDVNERVRAADTRKQTGASAPLVSRVTLSMSLPMRHSPSKRWESLLSMGGTASYQQLPGLGLGARVGAELRSAAIGFELGLSAFLTNSVTDERNHQAHFALYQADLGACALMRPRHALDLGMCSGMLVGLERATSSGYVVSKSQQTGELAAYAKLNSTWWPTPGVGARLSLGLGTSLIRDEFYAVRADGTSMTLHRGALFVPYLQTGICFVL